MWWVGAYLGAINKLHKYSRDGYEAISKQGEWAKH
jgi:hypothetical protein